MCVCVSVYVRVHACVLCPLLCVQLAALKIACHQSYFRIAIALLEFGVTDEPPPIARSRTLSGQSGGKPASPSIEPAAPEVCVRAVRCGVAVRWVCLLTPQLAVLYHASRSP